MNRGAPPYCSLFTTVMVLLMGICTPGIAQEVEKRDTVWFGCRDCNSLNGGEACFGLIDTVQTVLILKSASLDIKSKLNKRSIHGNFNYDFLYRSRVDTPFQQNDFQQHTIRTKVNLNLMDKYPVTLYAAYIYSNSPYFKPRIELNASMDQQMQQKQLQEQVVAKSRQMMETYYDVRNLENKYHQLLSDASHWNALSTTPGFNMMLDKAVAGLSDQLTQRLVTANGITGNYEEIRATITGYIRGNELSSVTPILSSLSGIADEKLQAFLCANDSQIDSLKTKAQKAVTTAKEAQKLYKKIEGIKSQINDSVSLIKGLVEHSRSTTDLNKILEKIGINKDSIPRHLRMFASLKSLSIGRSFVDYTPLTVRNISITGLNTTLSVGPTISVAAGVIDYRFRDFVFRNTSWPRQTAMMARVGLSGDKNKGLFFTGYTGKREIISPTGSSSARSYNISGFSVQYILPLNPKNTVSLEYAKSNVPVYRGAASNTTGNKAGGGMLNFKLRDNEAYSLSYNGNLTSTHTRISARYQKIGSSFQSLAFYTLNSNQNSYSLVVDQNLYKNTILIKAGIRKNEFVYPYLSNVSSQSIFKTVQLTIRKKGWPTVVAGYYPSTQLVVMPDQQAAEYTYQSLSASAIYNFRLLGLAHSAVLSYSRFFNQSPDSNFVYFNANNISYQHALYVSSFVVQAGYTSSMQSAFQMQTLEGSLAWQHKGISFSGGLKWNQLDGRDNLLGYKASMCIPYPKLGLFSLNYEYGALPAWNEQKILPVSMGRLTYSKIF